MFRKVAGTVGTRLVIAVISFGAWTLNANLLGPEIVGTVSLIIFSVAVIQLLTNFFAGSALVYLTPRTGIYRLFIPAYAWSFILSAGATALLLLAGRVWPVTGIIPEGYGLHVAALALVLSLSSANQMLLLGLEKIRAVNVISLVQSVVMLAVLLLMLFGSGTRTVITMYAALLVSGLAALVLGLISLRKDWKRVPLTGMGPLLGEILRFGTYVQVANLCQTLNYRISLKFVDHFSGRGAVGVLSLGLQLAESLWIISRSMATVQFARLSNDNDFQNGVRLTVSLVKVSLVVTTLAMLMLLAIPSAVYEWVFSARFTEVKAVIAALAAGIVTLSISIILSGFFSGINKPWHNTISSAAGLVFTVIFGLWLIPAYGIRGAGVSASVSYLAITLYQLIVFARLSGTRVADWIPRRNDFTRLVSSMRQAMDRNG